MTSPAVSVLMPVHNGARYLEPAVRSILDQEFKDFELVVVDDGSTDGSADLISSLRDARVRVVPAGRVGLVGALNIGLESSDGEFVARMDSDDVARGDRLAKQVAYLRANERVGVVSSHVRLIGSDGAVIGRQRTTWSTSGELRQGLLYERRMKPVIHPSVMVRREVLDAVAGYRDFRGAEDIDLWLRALDVCEFGNLSDELLDYRMHPGGVSRERGSQQQLSGVMAAVNWMVKEQTGVDLFAEMPELFAAQRFQAAQRLEDDVLPVAEDFWGARAALRHGRLLSAVGQIGRGSLRHRTLLRPGVARTASRRVIVDTVAAAVDELTGRR